MKYSDIAPRLLGWVFIACALFFGLRSGGPLRSQWVEWKTARQVGRLARSHWDELSNTETTLGSRTGAVSAVEFIDYECSYCRELYDTLTQFLRNRPTAGVAVRYLLHRDSASQLAGAAGACAARQGRFDQMHAYLFADTTWMRSSEWRRVAEAAGVQDTSAWERCVRSRETREALAADREWAEQLRIMGTPTLVTPDGVVRFGTSSIKAWMARSPR